MNKNENENSRNLSDNLATVNKSLDNIDIELKKKIVNYILEYNLTGEQLFNILMSFNLTDIDSEREKTEKMFLLTNPELKKVEEYFKDKEDDKKTVLYDYAKTNPSVCASYATRLHNSDKTSILSIHILEDYVIKSKKPELIIDFSRQVSKSDNERLGNAIIDLGDMESIIYFNNNIAEINTDLLVEKLVKERNIHDLILTTIFIDSSLLKKFGSIELFLTTISMLDVPYEEKTGLLSEALQIGENNASLIVDKEKYTTDLLNKFKHN